MNSLDVTLGEFNTSLNFIFGLTSLPDDFDVMNNQYVDFIGYELTKGATGHLVENKHEFERCPQDFLD